MKKRIIIIALSAVLVIALAVAMVVLLKDQQNGGSIDTSDPYAEVSLVVSDVPRGDLVDVAAKNFPGAPDYEVTVEYNKSDDTYSCVMQNNPEDYYYSDTYMNLMVATLSDMEANSIAADGENVNTSDYGIDENSITYVMTFKDGSTETFRLGSPTPLTNGYYCKVDSRNTIYIIGSYKGSTLQRNMYEMRTVTVYPEMESYYDLYRMRIVYPDGSVVDSCQLSTEEVQNGSSYAMFKFTEPLEIGINDDLAKNTYYTAALNLSINEILQDSLDNLESFGLDNPTSITYYNTSGDETTIFLGNNIDDAGEYRYGMMKGNECVFSVRGPFDFLTLDIYSLVDTTIWSHSINDVKMVSIKSGDESYEIYIDAYVNDEDSSDNRFYAEMDKVPLDEDSTRNTYVQFVSFPTLGYIKDFEMTDEEVEALQADTPVFTMDITYDDDSTCSIKLHTINDMQVAAEVDGNMLFYTSRSHMIKILEYCAMLRSGEIIPEI